MDLQPYLTTLGSICSGCLSSDRKLSSISDGEIRKFFTDVLDPLEPKTHVNLQLCWECLALVRKSLQFKQQVKQAHKCLIQYTHHYNILPLLSKLTTTKTDTFIIHIHEDPYQKAFTDKHCNNRNQPDDNKQCNCDNYAKSCSCIENKCTDYGINHLSDEVPVVEAILVKEGSLDKKIEDSKEGDMHLVIKEEFDCTDDFFGDNDNEEMYIKTDLKPDQECLEPVVRKKRTKMKTKMDFDDSDDEPLKVKKEKDDFKAKKRKTKKSREPAVKVDRRKNPGPKRERPSGVVSNARVANKLKQLNVAPSDVQMVALSWEEVEAERQKALASVAFTRHEYRCYDCAVGFNHRSKLDTHMKKHDPAAGACVCSVCRVRCRTQHALTAHRRRHRVRWRCTVCGAQWSRAGVAADHRARAHAAPPPTHTCAVCGHTETSLGKLRNHLKNHAERQKCEICGKMFRDKTSLKVHLFIHKGEKEHSCPKCGKKFLFKKAMEIHMVTHEVSEQLYCYMCDMNFKNRMSYYQHMRYNLKHIDPAKLKYACPLCDKRFAKSARLHEHNVAVHLKVTPIGCTVEGCSFACSSRPVLRTHIRMVHRNLKSVRNHVCDTCGKAYTTKKILEGHMRSHTGERPFHCQHCRATFGYEAALYNHNRLVHLGDKRSRARPSQPAPAQPWIQDAGTHTSASVS